MVDGRIYTLWLLEIRTRAKNIHVCVCSAFCAHLYGDYMIIVFSELAVSQHVVEVVVAVVSFVYLFYVCMCAACVAIVT